VPPRHIQTAAVESGNVNITPCIPPCYDLGCSGGVREMRYAARQGERADAIWRVMIL
jgi:hypothetical protein